MTTIENLLQQRKDLSNVITHFTREVNGKTACANLISILTDGCLKAVNEQGMAKGQGHEEQRVVCFTETPVNFLWTLVERIKHRQIKLEPYGVVFSKRWIVERGGNPVWYISAMKPTSGLSLTSNVNLIVKDPEALYRVPSILKLTPFWELTGDWRHLMSNNRKDFSWEREWRIVGDVYFHLHELKVVLAPKEHHQCIREAIIEHTDAAEIKLIDLGIVTKQVRKQRQSS